MDDLKFDISSVLIIRCKQTCRILAQLGVIRVIVLLLLSLFVFAALYKISTQLLYVLFFFCIWIFLIASIHAKRPDKTFLHIHKDFDKFICSVEYFLLSIPFITCLLLCRQWLSAIGLVLICFGTGFITIDRKKKHKTRNKIGRAHV
jgi:hypothetical protein